MFFWSCVFNCLLLVGLCYSSPVYTCEEYLQTDLVEEVKGTFYENGGLSCDATWSPKILDEASSFTKLYLLLRDRNQNYSEIIYGNLTSFYESGFDATKPTKILIHGWLEYGFDGFVMDLTNTYFALPDEDMNVLSVDWSKVADLLYPVARIYVEPVGNFMAEFLDWLVSEAEVSIDSLHVIGLSLGAHVAGVMGEKSTAGKIGRITGLDPAGPMFGHSLSGRLDSTDAQFVDIIHTCGHWAGYFKASGHIDFYPNDGEFNQPGCDPTDLGVCSHKRSYHLFNESISELGFISTQCDSWGDFESGECDSNNITIMGEHVDQSARGKFYLYTKGSYPYVIEDTFSLNNEE